MLTIQQLKEQRTTAVDSAKAVQALADKEDNRPLSEDEQTKFDAFLAESRTLQQDIENRESLATEVNDLATVPARKTHAGTAATSVEDEVDPDRRIQVGKDRIIDDPKKGFRGPRDYMSAVMDAGRRGSTKNQGLQILAAAGSDEQGEYADVYGGFLIPDGLAPGILKIEPEADFMGGRTRSVPMASNTVKFNARVDKDHSTSVSGGLIVTRRAETSASSSSRLKLAQVVLEANSLFGFAYATEELMSDSPESFAALIADGFSDEFTSTIIDERLNGDGVGKFLGIANSASLLTITKEVGQSADTILYENIVKMRARCWGYQKAIWLANTDTIPQLMFMNQSIGTGGAAVWQPSAREDHPDLMLGRPIFFTEYAKTLGDKGDIYLTNWGEYLEGTLQPLKSAESMHVRFINHERCFKFWLRNAGTPHWASVLTPKNGATQSPFVTLAARA